ncbi:MAG: hypothetical protein U9N73_03920 [Candidatus Auribacterota bacterium]|nr:hypothetical protein [Candidatus Auribacterota bacterium]
MRLADKVESKFLVPLRGDKSLSSGRLHSADKWKWLQNELNIHFGGYSKSRTLMCGEWSDPETGEIIGDESREYYVDIRESQLSHMYNLITEVAVKFQQKCIRFVYKGDVYYIENKE